MMVRKVVIVESDALVLVQSECPDCGEFATYKHGEREDRLFDSRGFHHECPKHCLVCKSVKGGACEFCPDPVAA